MGAKSWTAMEKKILRRMRAAGKTYREIAERLGKTEGSVATYANRLKQIEALLQVPPVGTLCWYCRWATGRIHPETGEPCPWVAQGGGKGPRGPVEGWKVRESTVLTYGGPTASYHVLECPMFERDAEPEAQEPED